MKPAEAFQRDWGVDTPIAHESVKIEPAMSEGAEEAAALERSWVFRWLQRNRHKLNEIAGRSSLIPDTPVLDSKIFDWAGAVAEHWEEIRDEARGIYQHLDAIPPLRDISPDHRGIVADNSWRSFFLVGYGNEMAENIARAPRTAELVKKIPGLNSAFFSILAPGAHISRHRGVAKAFFTAHLGLVVPKDWQNCTMQVEDEFVHWREGEWTIFDDVYHHEVWNNTDQERIILLCQVERPMRFPGNLMKKFFMWYLKRSPFVTDAQRELSAWENAFAEAEKREAA